MCELGEQLEQEKTRCEDLVRQDRQEVNQFFQTLEAVLARKKQAYLQALDKASAEVARVYDPLIHKVKDLQVCVIYIKSSSQIGVHNVDNLALAASDKLEMRMTSLLLANVTV